MNFSSNINDGLDQEINRICGTNVNTYPFKAKASRINDALDRYLSIAFRVDKRWAFDDITQTSPPIDIQDIVSGTNRYKFSDFTQKILNLIKLEILDSGGNGIKLTPERMNALGQVLTPASGRIGVASETFQELYLSPQSGTPTHYIKYGDFIYLRPSPNYDYTAGLKAYFNRAILKYSFVSFIVTLASPGVFTSTAHGLSVDDEIVLQTDGALPTGLSVNTTYYIVSVPTADTFTLSATKGGTAIDTSGSQSGTHIYLQINKEPGIPAIHHKYLCRRASLPYLIEKKLPQLDSVLYQVKEDEEAIEAFFSNRDGDTRPSLNVKVEDNK